MPTNSKDLQDWQGFYCHMDVKKVESSILSPKPCLGGDPQTFLHGPDKVVCILSCKLSRAEVQTAEHFHLFVTFD